MKRVDTLTFRRPRHAWWALGLLLAGCAGTPEAPRALSTPGGRSFKAGFVYQEEVYAAGAPFSLRDLYWNSFFPQAATAFKEAYRFDSYEEALRSEVDLLVVGEATVHGAREGFKVTLEVVCRDLSEREIMRHGFHEKTATAKTADLVFQGLGTQAADVLASSRKLRKSSPRTIDLTL
jgi:hypothetical protein